MSWQVNPATGDYLMTKGAPIDDDSLIYPAYIRIKVPRKKWLYAPDDKFGCDFNGNQRFNGADLIGIQTKYQNALQPMIDDGRASEVNVTYPGTQLALRNNGEVDIAITDAEGVVESLKLPPVGD
jgi:phage gp46-like protein